MSGFDPAWLDLREPVDARSRAPDVQAAAVARFSARDPVTVVDLASGAGSMLRALAPNLPDRQRWTLIDHDRALLDHAGARLADWADDAFEDGGGRLTLRSGARTIEVERVVADLARDPLPDAAARADLVTASALFDLVGADWIAAFAQRLAAANLPLYASLIYDGRKTFRPRHELDDKVLAAFNLHQRGDKGFGPALGPAAGDALREALGRHGYACMAGESPWALGPDDRGLARALVEGIAAAVAETPDAPNALDGWISFRRAAAGLDESRVDVGHVDLWLTPPGRATARSSSAPARRL